MTRLLRTLRSGVAPRVAALAATVLGGPLPVRLRAWDGSEAGPDSGPVVVLRHRRALRRLLWQPGELGLAEAYIAQDVDVEGELTEGLRSMWAAAREHGLRAPRATPTDRARAAALAIRLGALGPRPPAPAGRARLHGSPHSRARDRAAISHHYDLSNTFYQRLLDETMAYSCGYWARTDSGFTPADAQRAKLELICRKLALRPGTRLLDIGCGWGSLTLHAAEHHGVSVTAVTLAGQQAAHVRERVRARGLSDRVEVVCQDYRDIEGGGFDGVAAVEMGEHVGDGQYPAFAEALCRLVMPSGRVLVQQMSRRHNAPGGGPFIETYIAPDMHMRPLGETTGLLEAAGLEVRHVEAMREDYVRTIAAWHHTLEADWDGFVGLVGEEAARVWRLYLAGGGLAFEQGRMGVDQILCVRPGPGVSAAATDVPTWYEGLADR
ncbi:SAM-dependent methyltransferase [Streptomyces xanthii]|uniref:Class I SAM-dependent methyltransferase n=1 Tax=Streptomyces xanthii TaxID=2768069 RepID=A0A7H1BHV5_9ACTN|nr:cyclopropane-fatty-acyl-phospholipid synthase family protein [Streptomyces xanthii]QNS08310.1 class I SAM-dependent methyltransferase [Streptomyces xanthii]